MKIAIAGTGYLGLSNGVLLAQHNEVIALDVVREKIEMLNKGVSLIEDKEIQEFLDNSNNLNPKVTPTNYNPDTNFFNTQLVKLVIKVLNKFKVPIYLIIC